MYNRPKIVVILHFVSVTFDQKYLQTNDLRSEGRPACARFLRKQFPNTSETVLFFH